MSKFCSQQLPVCKVIPPSGYGSRKSAWLSSGLMGWFSLFLSVCNLLLPSLRFLACFGRESLSSLLPRFSTKVLARWLGMVLLAQPFCGIAIADEPAFCKNAVDGCSIEPRCDNKLLQLCIEFDTNGIDPSYQSTINDVSGQCYENCSITYDQRDVAVDVWYSFRERCWAMGGTESSSSLGWSSAAGCIILPAASTDHNKLEILDPACSTDSASFCEGNLLQTDKEGKVVLKEPKDLGESAKVERSGVVADGVTQLLLRVESSEAITFTIKEAQVTSSISDCKWGKLMQRDASAADCDSVTADPEQGYAFATYLAPINYPSDIAEIPAKFTIEAKTSTGKVIDTQELQLRPPPVILVHGVWDSPNSWDWVYKPALEKAGYQVYSVNHNVGEFPANGTFDPLSKDSTAIPRLISVAQDAIYNLRKENIAATQVDVVGHSMGGLIARATVKTTNYLYQYSPVKIVPYTYERLDNYNKGDFHKIITIGTPHQGTRIADVLVHGKCKERPFNCDCEWAVGVGGEIGAELGVVGAVVGGAVGGATCLALTCQPERLETTIAKLGRPIGPAIYGFQTGSSAIKNVGDTPVPSHAIVGIAPAGIRISFLEAGLNGMFSLYNIKTVDGFSTVDDILGGENHDAIVPAESQRGGLGGSAITTFQNVDHLGEIGGVKFSDVPLPIGATPTGILTNVTDEIAGQVLSLLSKSPESEFFSHFTALPPQAGNSDVNFEADKNRCEQEATTRSVRDNHVSKAVLAFEPAPGTIVTPGQKVKISLEITGGDVQDGAIISIDGQLINLEGAPPYAINYTVPENANSQISIYVQTINGNLDTETYAVKSHLTVKLPDTATTGTTETVPVGSCGTTNETSYTVPLDRSGFYIIEATLPADKRPGVWSLLIDSMSKSPLRSKNIGIRYQGGWHGGVILKENGLSPSWVAFSVGKTESVTIKASDFLNNLPSFKLEVVKQNDSGWKSVFGPVDALPEQNYTTPPLKPGFYAVVVTGRPESPRGQLGIFVKGNTLYGAVTGGWIDHTGVGYSAFFAGYPQTADLKLLFCGSYGLDGAGEPAVRVLYQKEDGSQEVYWDAK